MAQTCMYNDENSTTKAAWQLTKRHGDARMLASIGLPAQVQWWVGRQQAIHLGGTEAAGYLVCTLGGLVQG